MAFCPTITWVSCAGRSPARTGRSKRMACKEPFPPRSQSNTRPGCRPASASRPGKRRWRYWAAASLAASWASTQPLCIMIVSGRPGTPSCRAPTSRSSRSWRLVTGAWPHQQWKVACQNDRKPNGHKSYWLRSTGNRWTSVPMASSPAQCWMWARR